MPLLAGHGYQLANPLVMALLILAPRGGWYYCATTTTLSGLCSAFTLRCSILEEDNLWLKNRLQAALI